MDNIIFVTKSTSTAAKVENQARTALAGVKLEGKFIIAIGGDGTMLQAIKDNLHQDVVFIGISAGSLGLLQTVSIEQIPNLVEALTSRNYELIKAPLLIAAYCEPVNDNVIDDKLGGVIGYAFNDISVERQESRAAKFKLKVDNSTGNFVGDGVIFSTPLGSTAYSLAAGGPIIDSEVQNTFVVTPNNPHISNLHSSLYRPHVLSKNRKIRIELSENDQQDRPLQVAIDGQVAARDVRSPLRIGISDKFVNILQLEKDSLSKQIEEKRLGRL